MQLVMIYLLLNEYYVVILKLNQMWRFDQDLQRLKSKYNFTLYSTTWKNTTNITLSCIETIHRIESSKTRFFFICSVYSKSNNYQIWNHLRRRKLASNDLSAHYPFTITDASLLEESISEGNFSKTIIYLFRNKICQNKKCHPLTRARKYKRSLTFIKDGLIRSLMF